MRIFGFNIGRVLNKRDSGDIPVSGVRNDPPTGGASLSSQVETANRWRDQLNPLRSLTVALAVAWFEEEMRGVFANLQWAYRYVEMTDPDLLALVERRTSAIQELDWNIKIIEGAEEDPRAELHKAELEKAYERIGNLYDLFGHLAMATFRQFAVAQPVDANGVVSFTQAVRFDLLPQWNFARNGQFGAWYWNPKAEAVAGGTASATLAIPEKDIILRTHERPVDRIGLVKFIRANVNEKDWDSFCEIYGIEQPVVIGPPNVPEDKETEYRTAAENIANGGGGYVPNGTDVKYPNSQKREAPFKNRLDHLSEKLILAGTGGMLTMLAEAGSGTLAGGAHADTFRSLARAEARKISEVMQRQFDARILAAKFPGEKPLAYFELAANEELDSGTVIDHAVKLSQAGFALDPAEIERRTGYKVTVAPAPTVQGPMSQIPGRGIFNKDVVLNGDEPGHPFRGNQFADGSGGGGGGATITPERKKAFLDVTKPLRKRAMFGDQVTFLGGDGNPVHGILSGSDNGEGIEITALDGKKHRVKKDEIRMLAGGFKNRDFVKNKAEGASGEIADPSAQLENATPSLVADAVEQTLGIREGLLAPFFAHLEQIAADGKLSDEQFLAALEEAAQAFPELLTKDTVAKAAEPVRKLIETSLANAIAVKAGDQRSEVRGQKSEGSGQQEAKP